MISWANTTACSCLTDGSQWNLVGNEVPGGPEEEVKHFDKCAGGEKYWMLTPDRILLSQVGTQEGQLPAEHISEVPVPPPLCVG